MNKPTSLKSVSAMLITLALLLGSLLTSPAINAYAKVIPHGTLPQTTGSSDQSLGGDGDTAARIASTEMPSWVIPYFLRSESRFSTLVK